MRVLAISHNFPHEEDLTCGIYATRQLTEMARQGADIVALVPIIYAPGFIHRIDRFRDFGTTRKLVFEPKIQAYVQAFIRPPGRYFLPYDGRLGYWASKRKIRSLHSNAPFDVIVALGFRLEADMAIRIGKLLNLPSVGIGLGSDVNIMPTYGKKHYHHFVYVARNLDAAVATGQGVADKIAGIRGGEVPTVYGLVDLNIFRPVKDKLRLRQKFRLGDELVFLFVGHLNRAKGIYELIEAFCRLRGGGKKRLVICGNGMKWSALHKLVNDLGKTSVISLMGEIRPEEISQWMQASDVFVLPSYHEGMPNAVMEAMACGVPVITTSVGGLPAAIGDSKGAKLISPRSVAELKAAMEQLISNQELRQTMGEAARQLAEEKFSIQNNAAMLLDILQHTVDRFRSVKHAFHR